MVGLFDGLGTELISLVIGLVTGAGACHLYNKSKIKLSQKSEGSSSQIQVTNAPNSNLTGNVVSLNGQASYYNVLNNNEINDPLDIRNFPVYSDHEIEAVLTKGNDSTRRRWIFLLITNNKPEYLIKFGIKSMSNNAEKYKLICELFKHDYKDSKWNKKIYSSMNASNYPLKVFQLYLENDLEDELKEIFKLIKNEKYVYDALIMAYKYNRILFNELYDNGKSLSEDVYKNKMIDFLESEK